MYKMIHYGDRRIISEEVGVVVAQVTLVSSL